jgi:F-type H+-transporting ATPase subunit b
MEIDWITVSAQIVNFLILVWLLKHFLYQPIIRAMDRREQHISEQLNEAQERESKADEKAHHYQNKSDELERRRDEILDKARAEAEQQKKQMLDEARTEVVETREHWQRQVNQEKEEFLGNLRRQAVDAVQCIARKALLDLADAELEERIIHSFLGRLKSLDKDARKALSDTAEPLRITTAFELDSAMRGRLTRAVHEHLADGINVDYTHSPDLLCGIELTSGGRRLSWNLADFTEELTARIEEAFSPTESAKDEDQ